MKRTHTGRFNDHGRTGAKDHAEYQAGSLANYVSCTPNTGRILEGLASLTPRTLAVVHGSSTTGDRRGALHDLAAVLEDVLDKP